jgi:signal peptidase II
VTRIDDKQTTQTVVSDNPNYSERTINSNRERWLLFAIAGLVLILDILSKEIIRNNLPLYTYWAPFPALEQFFRFTHTSNTGVAFGLFQNANLLFAIFASIVSIGIIFFNQKLEPGNALLRIALGLQLGGALGNLIDRILFGSVTDFLDFGPWPVFNVADTAVVAGVLLMGFVILREERREQVSKLENDQESTITSLENTGQDESTAS